MFNESVNGFPVSPQQEHLWQLQETGAVGPYRAGSVWRIEGRLDVAALGSALAEVVRRHEILRTAFVGFQGLQLPLQVITAPRAPELRRSGSGDLTREVRTGSFDLERGDVLSVSLVPLSPDEHLLAFSLPGVCADAATLDNLMREISRCYRQAGVGTPEEPLQYADAAQFFRQILDSEEAATGKEHWRRHIVLDSAHAPLPLESSRIEEEPFSPDGIERSLGADVAARAEAVARRSNAGVEALFFTCWQVLLRRLTERPDLTVAAAVDGRPHEELKDALGLFARHLPVPVTAREETPFDQLVEQVHHSFLTVRRWQEAFSWALVDDSGAEPERLHWPFCFELREPLAGFTTAGLKLSPLITEACWDRFKLKLALRRRDDGLTARFEYDRGCLAGAQVERLASAFEALLHACLEHPETRAAELPIVGPDEWRQLVFGCNDTWVKHPPGERLHDPFEAQVERTPEAVAAVFGERRMTYRELDRRAGWLARRLRGSGVGPESIVAIHLERSFAMLESILAVLKAGGAYLPLDPDYPRERLAFILEDAKASVLVTEESLASGLPSAATAGVVILYAGEDTEPAESGIRPRGEATAENAAYLIYTSGSTGRPKGVVVSHRAIVNRLRWMQREFPLTPADRVLQKTPYGFDASIWELFSPLWAGAQLILAEPGAHRDSARMVELITAHGVTRLQLVPSLLRVFLDEPHLGECSSLTHLFCGGEALRSEWRERVFKLLDCRLINLYGPTEATIDASFHPCRRGAGEGLEPIGRPLDNVQVHLLGPGMQCVATGMAGHLHIGGAGLARGYQGRPDLTAERFLPDFLSVVPGGRLYATGDLARRREDGTIEYLGRTDQQVKVHGVRIELGEIEAVLSEHPGVEEAVVVAQTGESGAYRLAAYVVPPGKRSLEPGEALTLPNGLEVAYLNRSETQAIYREIFVDRTYLQHGIVLPDGAVVFDAGANIGLFTLFVHQSCEKPRVFAFEPIPPTFARLRRNVELYGLEVELFNCGLGSSPGTATFSFYRNWSGMSGIHADRAEDEAMTRTLLHNQDQALAENADELLQGRFETELFSCRMTTLSEVIARYGIEEIDLLKVDVEKSELDVLAGIVESDWGKIRQIVLEAHDRNGQLAALTGLLRDHGFEVAVEQDAWLTGTPLYNLYAVRREASGRAPQREPGSSRHLAIAAPREPTPAELRDFLRAKLQEPMVPAHVVFLDALPRMANGKVDRRALPAPSDASDRPEVEPRTPAETLLAGIWSGLLGKHKVSVEDNFFELGGDSILAIQLVSRAKAAGLELSARQVFSHQTIARLAAVAGSRTAGTAEPSEVTGPVPLTPAQAWFFAQDFADPHHFNQAVLLSVRRPLGAGLLSSAVRALVARHDALRLRFEGDGQAWTQRLLAADDLDTPLARLDLSNLPARLCRTEIESVAVAVAPSLDPSRGPLLRIVYFDLGPFEPGRLLMVIHHLAVDGVSWRILLEDLETACEQLEAGQALSLAPATTSFAAWARHLDARARAMPLEPELAWWRGECLGLPAEGREARAPEDVELRDVSFDLSARETQALLHEIHAAYRTQINEVLLTALAGALLDCGLAPVIELEGHGREDLVAGVDLSRTVGWFTTLFPVRLEIQPAWGPDESIKAVKEHLRAIPRWGIGYGLLRYLRAEEPAVRILSDLAPPEVCFNYLGQLDQALPPGSRFSAAGESSGPPRSRRSRRSSPLDVNAHVLGGRLRVTVQLDARARQLSAVEPLAERFHERLLALIAHCRTRIEQRIAGYTPMDFPLAGFDQRELDRHLGTEWGIEDVYPLTPLQEGIFFHSRLAPGTGVYVGQLTCTLPADLDFRRLRQAWERLVERHGVLRTAFLWEGLEEPRQAVRRSCALPWEELDWRGLPEDEQQRRFEALRHRDRHAPLRLDEAPLMRFSLIRLDHEPGFIWTFHHLLMDGWSLPLLIQELAAIYTALEEGREPALPPAWPFSDYVAWLRRQDPSRLEPFWREELAGFTAPTSFSIVHPVESAGDSGYAEHRIRVSRELTTQLKALAARHKLTLQTLTLGAWALLVSRYSGDEDVVFGSVVSGRPAALPGVEAMVGIFINTLPVRARVDGEEPLVAWLQRLQERQLARQEVEHSPLARIQRWSEIPAGSPLFETLYAFQNYPNPGEGDSGRLRVGDVQSVEHTNYPITLVLTAVDRISLLLTSDRARVDGDAAQRLLQHLTTLLSSIAEGPQSRLGELSWLGEAERHQLLQEWSDTAARFESEATLHGLFAEQASLHPGSVAVEQDGQSLTWGELRQRAGRLARRLVARGLRPEEPVAVLADRSPDLICALLGILEAGGAYLPLDPADPPERLTWMLRDAGASLLVAREAPPFELPAEVHRILLDAAGAEVAPAVDLPQVPATSLAYIMYTSGSTGRPKGVGVTHRNVVRLVRGTEYADLGPDQTWLQAAPVSFDASTLEIWAPLLNGGRLVLYPGRLSSLDHLARVVEAHGVTSAWLTAGLFHEMVDHCLDGLRPLSQLLVGGDVVSSEHARCVLERHPGLTLIDGYGPTEGTTFTCCHRLTAPPRAGKSVPIGRPIGNTRVYVLDERLSPVPVGVEGELYAGGEGLARGYVNRPDLTAERFVPAPFGPAGERLYRTGDRVRLGADGTLEFRGRVDRQIKLRGFRIELGEIEAALVASPGVSEAVVTVDGSRSAGNPGDRRLVAYVVGDVEVAELRRSLRERLPDFMVPAAFVKLAALPLTANGKVDRKALPAPDQPGGEEAAAAPRTPVEEILAGIWIEILGLERVGADSDFFDLGGHSLLATQVMSRLRETFGVEMPLRELFENPVLANLAMRVEAAREDREGWCAPPLVPVPRVGPLPLSFAQQRLWFIDQLDPGTPLYNIPAALRIEGPLDSAVLARCLGEVVRRHEALRTVFAAPQGSPVQVVQPALPFHLPLVDLTGLPEGEREPLALDLARDETLRPFDLARGPLLRGVLLRLGAVDHVALLTMHHIVSDGWSVGILIHEVAVLYAALAAGSPSPLPELPVQYADFSDWQRSWLQGEVLERQMAFWRRQVTDLPPLLELPTDRPRPAVQSFRGASRPVWLAENLVRQAQSLSRHESATLFMVVLAGFKALLARWSGQHHLAAGIPVAGRNRRETEGLIGFFVNMLVLRSDFSGEPSLRDLVGQVRETALAAYAHQDVPFEKLVQEISPKRSLAHNPLFQVMFVLQNAPVAGVEIESLRLRPVSAERTTAMFDLTLSLEEHDGGLVGRAVYATDLFDPATVERLILQYERLLASVLEAPDLEVSEIPLLSSAERHHVLTEWNDTAAFCDEATLIHQPFEIRAARNPGAVAALFGDMVLTYGELEAEANRLAHHLVSLGIGRGSLVGIHLRRSLGMLSAVLAVLKAGAAYVPLEIGHPPARLHRILASLEISCLLTETPELDSVREMQHGLPVPIRVVCLDRAGLESAGDSAPLHPTATPDDLAYIIFTSGSTGAPKGVMVSHRPVINLFRWALRTFSFSPADRVLFVTSLSFDLSVFDIFGLLAAGGSIRIATEEEIRDPQGLLQALCEEPITFWDSAPAALEQTVPFLAGIDPLAGSALRLVFLSGDWIPVTLPDRIRDRFPGARLISLGGATEATVWSNVFPIDEVDPLWTSIPYGRPIENARYHVLDDRFTPCPVGVEGDLFIGGVCLAGGYAGAPELTAYKFLPDSWGALPGERLYRTGDRARYRPDGNLEFLGRRDSQVKLRGFRVELGEIEAALARHPGVRETAVLVREDHPGEKRLVAYLAAKEGSAPSSAELREYLSARLPEYMVPTAWVFIPGLPVTSNGKLDRRALPLPDYSAAADPVAPRTPTEMALAALWAEVLSVDAIGVGNHFFDLGGHSLLGTQLLSRISTEFSVKMPLRELFAFPTLAEMAARIEDLILAGSDEQDLNELLDLLDDLDEDAAAEKVDLARPLSGDLGGGA
jgi:amino acid adenylation domain-containing protein/non-ribosomal peptide synthase protein (TIGR01720 family)/FkbM family methyltransferase